MRKKKNHSVDVSIGPLTHADALVIFKLNDLSTSIGGFTIVRPSYNEDELFIRVKELEFLFARLESIVADATQSVSEEVIPSPF